MFYVAGTWQVPFESDAKTILHGTSSGTTVAGSNGTSRSSTVGGALRRAAVVLLQEERHYRCTLAVLPPGCFSLVVVSFWSPNSSIEELLVLSFSNLFILKYTISSVCVVSLTPKRSKSLACSFNLPFFGV